MDKKTRNNNLDLIRAVAVFFVVSSHFLLRNGFYEDIVAGKRMYVMVMMRYVFVSCVPMFLLLTGYLSGNKEPTWAYFRKLGHTLILYVMASVACILYKVLYEHADISLKEGILSIFDYSASYYAWYVEMYIGLFLLAPFLNYMYKGAETQRRKRVLLLVILFLTCGSSVFNIFDLTTPSFWHDPTTAASFTRIVPSWWEYLYPIEFYMIGMYLREYDWHISLRRNLLYIALAVVLFSTYNYYRSYQAHFAFGPWLGRSSLQNTLISVLLFTFLLHLPLNNIPGWLKKVIAKVSQLSFLTYLLSSNSDAFLYPILNQKVPYMTARLNYYPVIVPLSFVMSLAGAQILMWIYQLFCWLFRKIPRRAKLS